MSFAPSQMAVRTIKKFHVGATGPSTTLRTGRSPKPASLTALPYPGRRHINKQGEFRDEGHKIFC